MGFGSQLDEIATGTAFLRHFLCTAMQKTSQTLLVMSIGNLIARTIMLTSSNR